MVSSSATGAGLKTVLLGSSPGKRSAVAEWMRHLSYVVCCIGDNADTPGTLFRRIVLLGRGGLKFEGRLKVQEVAGSRLLLLPH